MCRRGKDSKAATKNPGAEDASPIHLPQRSEYARSEGMGEGIGLLIGKLAEDQKMIPQKQWPEHRLFGQAHIRHVMSID